MKFLYFTSIVQLILYSLAIINANERIRLNDGGYEGLVVAIKKDIKPENSQKIIENLKVYFFRFNLNLLFFK
jgi:hypothetical protein